MLAIPKAIFQTLSVDGRVGIYEKKSDPYFWVTLSFFIVMVISILMFSLLTWETLWLRIAYRLLLLPVVAGLSYEVIKLAGRHPNGVVGILTKPGLWLQKITTEEPDLLQLEVAIAALMAVIPENKEDDKW